MPETLKKQVWELKIKQGKVVAAILRGIFAFIWGNSFTLKNLVFDHSVLPFGRRMDNGESKWVNPMKKSINHSTSLVRETFWGLSCGFKI